MDVVIGNTTSSGLNSAFQLSGNDLFVQGNIGSASSVYTNGAFVAGTDSTLYGDGFITRTSGDLAFTTGGTGNLVFNTDSDSNIRVSSTAPGNGTNVMAISNTGASNNFNLVDLNMAVGAGDAGVDTNVALNINVPGPAESGDVVYGIQISAAAASAGTLNGLRIDGVSAGAGTQDAISIGGKLGQRNQILWHHSGFANGGLFNIRYNGWHEQPLDAHRSRNGRSDNCRRRYLYERNVDERHLNESRLHIRFRFVSSIEYAHGRRPIRLSREWRKLPGRFYD